MGGEMSTTSSYTPHGACLCGAVKFTIKLPTKWVAHCHCTRCQRANGAAFVTWVGVDEENAQIHNELGHQRWYLDRTSSKCGFCSKCGSPMFFQSNRYLGELHIARALFLDKVDRLPETNVFYDTHVDWINDVEKLPSE